MAKTLIFIARDEVVLGKLSPDEAGGLLEAGFLAPTDYFWKEGMPDWLPLSELGKVAVDEVSWLERAGKTMATKGGMIARRAGQLSGQIKALAGKSAAGINAGGRRVLEDSSGQIKNILATKVSGPLVKSARAAMHDDALMTKTFAATYDCLPKPICRFVAEKDFIAFCMEHRRKLLG